MLGAPRVIAIVLNWCAEADSAACLDSLAASDYESLEVLLVDNGSPDGSGDRLRRRYPNVSFLQTGANLGFAGGNNRGIEWALTRDAGYVMVVNDDTVVSPDCVRLLVQAAEESRAAAVAPQIRYFSDPELVACGAGFFSRTKALGIVVDSREPLGPGGARVPVTFVSGCCALFRAADLKELGGFDESFFAYVEDAELSLRFSRGGRLLMYEPRAQVLHKAAPRAVPTAFQVRQRDRNRRRLVAQHYGLADRLRFAAWFYPTRIAHVVGYALRGNWRLAAASLEGAFGPIHMSRTTELRP